MAVTPPTLLRPHTGHRHFLEAAWLSLQRTPHTGLERWMRFGLVVRGALYLVPGFFTLQWAFGRHHQPMDSSNTIDLAGASLAGRALLALIAVGLAGYAGWGVLRAVMDPLRRGHRLGGIVQRIGYLASAVAYTGLWWATVGVITGRALQVSPAQDWSVAMLARPFGGPAVVIIGLCWIFGSGIAQVVSGWRRTFARDLLLEHMGPQERRAAVGLGAIGLISRGLVFTLIGVLLVAAALHLQRGAPGGLEGALGELARQRFGAILLGAAGAGLMVFGAYSAMCARWLRIDLRIARVTMRPPPLHDDRGC